MECARAIIMSGIERLVIHKERMGVMPDRWIESVHQALAMLAESECTIVEYYAGSVDAFGYKTPTPEEVPLCIEDIGHPRFTYAVTKMLGESGFLNYSRILGFEATIVRYHNVYGPRMGFKHVIPHLVVRFRKGEEPCY
jgi:nucleoside-diphosphate-sugar epimerase